MRRINVILLACLTLATVAWGTATTSARPQVGVQTRARSHPKTHPRPTAGKCAPVAVANPPTRAGSKWVLIGRRTLQSRRTQMGAGVARAFSTRSRGDGTVSAIAVYVDAGNRAKRLAVALYRSSGCRPAARLTYGSLRSPRARRWNTVKVYRVTIKAGRTYWLAVMGGGGALHVRDRSVKRCTSYNSRGASGMASKWKMGAASRACDVSAYALGTRLTFGVLGGPGGGTSGGGGSGGAGAGLPVGVSLQAIDGGPTYFCSHGFVYACNDGWDSSSFFPVGAFYGTFASASDVSKWEGIGWNTSFRTTASSSASVIDAACAPVAGKCTGSWPIYVVEGGWGGDCGSCTVGQGETPGMGGSDPDVVGLESFDEPCGSCGLNTTDFNAGVADPLAATPSADQEGRFWWTNFTYFWAAFGGIGPMPETPQGSAQVLDSLIATPDGSQRHVDVQSLDEYWFAASGAGSNSNDLQEVYSHSPCSTYGTCNYSGWTPAEQDCGCRYGDILDMERTYQQMSPGACGGSNPICGPPTSAPMISYVETGGPDAPDTTAASYIQPPELNWAVWSSIVHGARMIEYFPNTFSGPGENQGVITNYPNGYFDVPENGQPISIYAQIKGTDDLIHQLATYINSPEAVGYVSVSPAPQTFSGIETRATYKSGPGNCGAGTATSGCFTIFADTRDAESASNISATFTTAGNYTGPVEAICDSRSGGDGDLNPGTCVNRTITATNGVFTDTFAKGSTVHIYQIPN